VSEERASLRASKSVIHSLGNAYKKKEKREEKKGKNKLTEEAASHLLKHKTKGSRVLYKIEHA
jgi:hypothetical protein